MRPGLRTLCCQLPATNRATNPAEWPHFFELSWINQSASQLLEAGPEWSRIRRAEFDMQTPTAGFCLRQRSEGIHPRRQLVRSVEEKKLASRYRMVQKMEC